MTDRTLNLEEWRGQVVDPVLHLDQQMHVRGERIDQVGFYIWGAGEAGRLNPVPTGSMKTRSALSSRQEVLSAMR